jgi:predicted Kef-type K+ transport protein
MLDPLIILLAFLGGLAFRSIGYPPLPGYLIAGFIAHGLGIGNPEVILTIANLGVLLLLFTIGLEISLKDIAAPQVWAIASLHMVVVVPLTALFIILAAAVFPVLHLTDPHTDLLLALALSFSSTVFAVKAFEDRGEQATYHASLAIGILILQDVVAVAALVYLSGNNPSFWALGLPLLILARPLLLLVLKYTRHGELVLLFGFLVAMGGATLFESVGLKAGLGALAAGMLLAGASQTRELYKSLVNLKDLFLIGFFVQIGYFGLPTEHMWFVALALILLIFLRPVLYFLLFVLFQLRARTALLAGAALFSYSEFGLVVAAFAVESGELSQQWLTTLALAVSLSFFIATPLNTRIHSLYGRFGHWLHLLERKKLIDAEVPADLGDADIVVLGMGRVGQGVYERLTEILHADRIVGVEEDLEKAQRHCTAGLRCVHGDASDHDFWVHSGLKDKKLVLISLTNHTENLLAVEQARLQGFGGDLAVVSRFPDEKRELESLGCIAFNLYGEAGHGFAEHVIDQGKLETS